MVKCLYHSAFIKWQIYLRSTFPAITLNRVKTFTFKLYIGIKQIGIIGHVKHPYIYLTGHALDFLT